MSDIRDLLRRDWDDTVSPELVERAARRTHRRARRHQALTAGTLALLLVVLTAGVTTALRTLDRTEVRLVDDPDSPPPPNAPPGWRLFDEPDLEPRVAFGLAWTGEELILWGGLAPVEPPSDRPIRDGVFTLPRDFGELAFQPRVEHRTGAAAYDPGRDTWRHVPDPPAAPRAFPATAWTGSELLLWGGELPMSPEAPGVPLAVDGVAYDPRADAWTAIPDAPLAGRTGAATVWTGDELLVWGGAGASPRELFDDGAGYDPRTGTWRMLSPSPLTARKPGFTVWTGAEFLVWAGDSAAHPGHSGPLFWDGAAYDPATDSWRELADVPLIMWNGGNAVWTGDQVLLVAHAEAVNEPQPVLLYDPATDTWAEVPAPHYQIYQSGTMGLVWTGDRAILVGRLGTFRWPPVEGQTEGWRADAYDPLTGRWTALPDPPEQLDQGWWTPELVWTGHDVLGWAGSGPLFAFRPGPAEAIGSQDQPRPAGGDIEALPEGALLFSADETTVSLRRDDGTVVDEFEMGGEATIAGLAARPGTEGERWAVAVSSSTGAHTDLEVRWRTPEGSIFFEDYWALAPPGPDGGFREEGVPLDAPVRVDATWSPDGDYLAWLDLDPEGEPALVVRTWADDGPGPAMAWKSFGDALPPGTRYEGLEGWQWLDQGVGGTREGRLLVAIRSPDGDRDVIGYRVRARADPLDEIPLVFEGFEDITLGQRLGSRVLAMAPEGGASAYALVADGEWPILELEGDELLARIALPDGMPRGMPGDEPFLTARDRLLVVGLRSTTGPGGEAWVAAIAGDAVAWQRIPGTVRAAAVLRSFW